MYYFKCSFAFRHMNLTIPIICKDQWCHSTSDIPHRRWLISLCDRTLEKVKWGEGHLRSNKFEITKYVN